MNGLWAMIFCTEDQFGIGAGVLFVQGNKAWGGNDHYFWHGLVDLKDNKTRGTLDVRAFTDSAEPIHPDVNDPGFYTVVFEGGYGRDSFVAAAHLLDQPEIKFTIQLGKCLDAPSH